MSTCSNIKPILATFISFFFLFLLSKVKCNDDISFRFEKFKPNGKDLIIAGEASISDAGILGLTKVVNGKPVQWSVGRAQYVAPVHIWESNRVASFVTTFSFRMAAPNPQKVSDALVFFLAPPDFTPGIKGGYLGLFDTRICSDSYHIVAVEFDTQGNEKGNNYWDPKYKHIGIDANCLRSQNTVKWDARYRNEVANVEIRYEASTKTLTASLTYPSDKKRYTVSSPVDLKAILPEWVRVGFIATTADIYLETHDVLNWSFTSTLHAKNNVALDNNARKNNASYTA